jgi:hypothetical protein
MAMEPPPTPGTAFRVPAPWRAHRAVGPDVLSELADAFVPVIQPAMPPLIGYDRGWGGDAVV